MYISTFFCQILAATIHYFYMVKYIFIFDVRHIKKNKLSVFV